MDQKYLLVEIIKQILVYNRKTIEITMKQV